MESAYRGNPDIGRYRLADEAGVGEKTARLFLDRQKSSMVNVVSLTDWHVPYHDEKAVACALKFCEVTQPDIIVMHEVHDFYCSRSLLICLTDNMIKTIVLKRYSVQ